MITKLGIDRKKYKTFAKIRLNKQKRFCEEEFDTEQCQKKTKADAIRIGFCL